MIRWQWKNYPYWSFLCTNIELSNHSPQKYCKIKPYNKSKTRGDNIEKNTTTIHNTNHANLHRMFKRRDNADEYK